MKPDLCKMFGKEVNEEFKLSGIDGTLKVNEHNELIFKHDSSPTAIWYPLVEQLNITAQRDIIDIPWVPKFDEEYWFVNAYGNIDNERNDYDEIDRLRIKTGNCFRTDKQAMEKGIPIMEQWKKELGW